MRCTSIRDRFGMYSDASGSLGRDLPASSCLSARAWQHPVIHEAINT